MNNIINNYKFIGKEPSLTQLEHFIKDNKELYHGINIDVIATYLDFAKCYGGYYYIGGHIKTFPNEKITAENIKKASEINKTTEITHQMEIYSQIRSIKELLDLNKILDVYYEYMQSNNSNYTDTSIEVKNIDYSIEEYIYHNNNRNNEIEEYYDYAPHCPMNMELYGGEGYRKLAAETTVGKKWIDYLEKYV